MLKYLILFEILVLLGFLYILKNRDFVKQNLQKEKFAVTDDITVTSDFYDITLNLPETHYLYDYKTEYYNNLLNNYIISKSIYNITSITTINIDKFISYIFNEYNIKSNYKFRILYSKINKINKNIIDYNCIIHQDTKPTALHFNFIFRFSNNTIEIIKYKILGKIFEDKLWY